jgi:phosphoglycerate dehydrogenase-like enzyme
MKVILHVAARANDLRPLAGRFPDVSFVITRTLDELAAEMQRAEVLVIWSAEYTPEVAAICKSGSPFLKWIQFTTSGIDTALKNGGFTPGTIITNCAGLRAVNLAEHAFTLLLFLSRQVRAFERARTRREWLSRTSQPIASLQGTTLLVLGMGAIGQAVARRARAFDMTVLGVSRAYKPDAHVQEVYSRENAAAAYSRADSVVVCLPSTAETRRFVDRRALAAMKPSAFIINISRGDVIDEHDLAEACATGVIGGAGLDVTTIEPLPANSLLWSLDNVFITPHVGGQGNDETELLMEMISENLRLYRAGLPMLRRVEY